MQTSDMQTTNQSPLAGLKVIELHAVGPVPFAGLQLQALGAKVTRVLPPMDPSLGLVIDEKFDVLNTGKSTRVINLKSAEGLADMHKLLSGADVLLEGFRPYVLEKLALGPDVLSNRFPALVLGRLSGFGRHGPLAQRAGHDINYLALSGVLNAIGTSSSPTVPLNLIADFGGGAMHLLLGVMAKLIQRSVTGIGGVADTSILAGTVGLTPMYYGLIAAEKWTLQRQNNLLDGGAPFYRVYACRDQRFVAVGALENKFFIELLSLTELSDDIDAGKQYDTQTWKKMNALLSTRFLTKDRDEWAELASTRDCCVTAVLDFIEASRSEHNLQNNWYNDSPLDQPGTMISFT